MRLVAEARKEDPELSLNQAVIRIGQRVGVNPDTLRGWCKQAAIDAGERPGTTTADAARIKALEQENRELKRGERDPEGGVGFLRVNTLRRGPVAFAPFFAASPGGRWSSSWWWLVVRCAALPGLPCWLAGRGLIGACVRPD
jgi:hypothetical protein